MLNVFRGPLLLLQKCHGILSLKDKTAAEPQFSSNSKKVPSLQRFMYTANFMQSKQSCFRPQSFSKCLKLGIIYATCHRIETYSLTWKVIANIPFKFKKCIFLHKRVSVLICLLYSHQCLSSLCTISFMNQIFITKRSLPTQKLYFKIFPIPLLLSSILKFFFFSVRILLSTFFSDFQLNLKNVILTFEGTCYICQQCFSANYIQRVWGDSVLERPI